MTTTRARNLRPTRALLLWLAASVTLGALIAPPLFNALAWAGREYPALEVLRTWGFERIFTRCIMLFALAGFPWLLKQLRIRSLKDAGWAPRHRATRTGLIRLAQAALTLGVLWVIGFHLGAYRWPRQGPDHLAGDLAQAVFGALLVGLIEETLFRGILFGALRKRRGFLWSAILSSTLFALIHFVKPVPPVGIVHAHWYTGLALVPHLFGQLDPATFAIFPYILTLFVMGMALCAQVEREGSLFGAVGLHAGWVFGLKTGMLLLARNHGRWPSLFGGGMDASSGYMALAMMMAWAAYLLLARQRHATHPTPDSAHP